LAACRSAVCEGTDHNVNAASAWNWHSVTDAIVRYDGAAARRSLATVGVVPEPSTPQEFAAFIRSEIEKWAGVMKFAGMKQEAY
jgi:tripartite-type tricarboxylate transporter receptor subunit TctC